MTSSLPIIGEGFSPHRVAVCILTRYYLQCVRGPPPEHAELPPLSEHLEPSETLLLPQNECHRLGTWLLSEISSCDHFVHPPFMELHASLCSSLGESLAPLASRVLCGALLRARESPDALFDQVDALQHAPFKAAAGQDASTRIAVAPESPLGLYVRKSMYVFRELSFESFARLYDDVCAYVSGMSRELREVDHTEAPGEEEVLARSATPSMESEPALATLVFEDDTDEQEHGTPVRTRISMRASPTPMERGVPATPKAAVETAASPRVVRGTTDRLSAVLERAGPLSRDWHVWPNHGGVVSRQQMQRFVHEQANRIRQSIGRTSFEAVEAAVQLLLELRPHLPEAAFLRYLNCLHHREFELAVDYLHQYFDYSVKHGRGARRRDADRNEVPVKDLMTQYAVLHLALLHFAFGHMVEARRVIHETVRIAQQNNDHRCLMHALGLLCRLASANGDSEYAAQLLQRCVSTQNRAESAAARLRTYRAHGPRAALMMGAAAPTKEELAGLEAAPKPVPTVDTQTWLGLAQLQLQDVSSATQSNPLDVWASLARSVEVNATYGLLEPAATAMLMRSRAWSLYGGAVLAAAWSKAQLQLALSREGAKHINPEDTALALANLAASPHTPGHLASALLDEGRAHFPADASRVKLAELSGQLEFERALLYRHDVDGARKLARRLLFPLGASALPQDFQFRAAALLAEAQLKFHDGHAGEAFRLAAALVRLCQARGEHIATVRLLLFLARIHQHTGDSASALPYVLRSLSLCRNFNLDVLECEGMLALAQLHLNMGSPAQGLAALRPLLPRILENCTTPVRVDVHVTMAKALLSLASGNEAHHAACLPAAQQCLAAAAKWAADVRYNPRLKEIFYLQARVFHQQGDVRQRNEAAAKFQRLAKVI